MRKDAKRYRQMEQFMIRLLVADGALFLLYLLFAGLGIGFAKVLTALLVAGLSMASLGMLSVNKELLRRRSLWMTAAAAGLLMCLLVSLIVNFPSPGL